MTYLKQLLQETESVLLSPQASEHFEDPEQGGHENTEMSCPSFDGDLELLSTRLGCRMKVLFFTSTRAKAGPMCLNDPEVEGSSHVSFVARECVTGMRAIMGGQSHISWFRDGNLGDMYELDELLPGDTSWFVLFVSIPFLGEHVGGLLLYRPVHERIWTRHDVALAEDWGREIGRRLELMEVSRLRKSLHSAHLIKDILFEHTGTPMFVSEADRTITMVNQPLCDLFGYSKKEVQGRMDWKDFVHPEDRKRMLAYHDQRNMGEAPPTKYEFRALTKEGQVRFLSISVAMVPGSRQRIVSMTDLTLLRQAQEEVSSLTSYDALTGLVNRTIFLDRLDQAIRWCERGREKGYALLFIDVSRYQAFNEAFGYFMGDEVLREIGTRLQQTVYKVDSVCRFGGDQFLVLLRDVHGMRQLKKAFTRLLETLKQPYQAGEVTAHLRFHVGMVLERTGELTSVNEAIQKAIIALKRAKDEGVESQVHSGEMTNQELRRIALEAELARAIEEGRIDLHYQPIIRLADNELIGFEALARWEHPTLGFVRPDEFIALAEETGLIIPLGRLLMEKGCMQLKNWQDENPARAPRLGINLSAVQLLENNFLAMVRSILRNTGVNPKGLTLEITESSILADLEKTRDVLDELRKMGISTCLDDFGTGYSSLTHLHRLPLDVIKIDRSFVHQQGREGLANPEIVSAVISMARSMKLRVVAEGIETTRQEEILRSWGAESGQGYHFSRPMSAEQAAEHFLNTNNQGQ